MKKTFSLLLSLALIFSLAACSGGTPSSSDNDSSEPSAPSSEPSTQTSEVSAGQAPSSSQTPAEATQPPSETGGILIAYFSWSGNTEQLAQVIQQETGGDLFEIAPATPYSDDYNELLDIAQQEQADDARPELADRVDNWDRYDVIFVGYPNWWSDAPMVVYTFLESYDFTGKTLIPFNTSSSGGFGRSLSGLEASAAGATLLEGLAITERDLGNAHSEVTAWIDRLNLG